MYSVYVDSNTAGDYATFWGFGPESFSGADYFTSATLADGNMSTGANGSDFEAIAIPIGRWMRHAVVCYKDATDTWEDFYYDLPNLSAMVQGRVFNTTYFSATSGTTFFRFLDVEWAPNETLDGRLCAAKCWQCKLPPAALQIEATSAFPVLDQYKPYLWGCWPLRTLSDRFDISGKGRHLYLSGDAPTSIADNQLIVTPNYNPYRYPELMSVATSGGGGGTARFRKTLSGIGSHSGGRQIHGW